VKYRRRVLLLPKKECCLKKSAPSDLTEKMAFEKTKRELILVSSVMC
jgi:hypothetical protein